MTKHDGSPDSHSFYQQDISLGGDEDQTASISRNDNFLESGTLTYRAGN